MAANESSAKVKAYFAKLPADARRELAALRDAIRDAAPGLDDAFGYGIPGYKLDGRVVMWYAAWKKHNSIYPLTETARAKFAKQLERYEIAKGTLRFPRDEPIPAALVKRIVKLRISELKANSKPGSAARVG
jgi:uncharacterized protein YdhG (YjbR/CyaY superfamily)